MTPTDTQEAINHLRAAMRSLTHALAADTLQVCVKCGSSDIHQRWDRDDTDCLHTTKVLYRDRKQEHMHSFCRNCAYDWVAPVQHRIDTSATADREPSAMCVCGHAESAHYFHERWTARGPCKQPDCRCHAFNAQQHHPEWHLTTVPIAVNVWHGGEFRGVIMGTAGRVDNVWAAQQGDEFVFSRFATATEALSWLGVPEDAAKGLLV